MDDVAGIVVDVLGEIGAMADTSPRRNRGGCRRWLIGLALLAAVVAVIIIAVSG